ncbi:hypothetical protein PAALTS15_02977 [Paenibacillus alvei TS-15]|uniref:Uncharacterized protein n=1 Tax=Paenibacillus alvei TS-15 TaxID=1117108 RepID=S9SW59_PAEAL|nr:hypothetical protein PAALTS15_02977 [Paenibacillus alvei TS-15]
MGIINNLFKLENVNFRFFFASCFFITKTNIHNAVQMKKLLVKRPKIHHLIVPHYSMEIAGIFVTMPDGNEFPSGSNIVIEKTAYPKLARYY